MSDGYGSLMAGDFIPATVTVVTTGGTPPPLVCHCGITDTFTRTTSSGSWGTSASGLLWDVNPDAYVDGSAGLLVVPGAGSSFRCGASFFYNSTWPLNITALVRFNRLPANSTLPLDTADSHNAGEGLSLWLGNGNQPYTAITNIGGVPTVWLGNSTNTVHTTASLTGLDLTQWVSVNWQALDASSTLELRVWQTSDPIPSSPTLTIAWPAGLLPSEYDTRLWANDSHPFTGGDIIVYCDSLDITGVNRCSEYRFDNFNRAVASGWGTSDAGPTWARSGSSNGVSTVASGFGTLQNSAATTTEVEGITTGVSGDFTAIVKCKVSSDTLALSAGFIFNGLAFGWTKASPNNQVYINDNHGHHIVATISNTFWAGVAGQAYFKASRIAGVASLTLWDEVAVEPSPQIVNAVDNGFYATEEASFSSFGTGAVGTQSVIIDYIGFDYVGKPCYVVGGVAVYPS